MTTACHRWSTPDVKHTNTTYNYYTKTTSTKTNSNTHYSPPCHSRYQTHSSHLTYLLPKLHCCQLDKNNRLPKQQKGTTRMIMLCHALPSLALLTRWRFLTPNLHAPFGGLHMCYTYIKACIHKDTQNVNEPSKFTIAAKSGNTGKSIRIVTASILDIFPNFKSLLWSRITKFY